MRKTKSTANVTRSDETMRFVNETQYKNAHYHNFLQRCAGCGMQGHNKSSVRKMSNCPSLEVLLSMYGTQKPPTVESKTEI